MYIVVELFHLLIAALLILVVLLQSGKGADIGAAFGGGSSQTVFGGRGASTFLSKLTSACAIIFMLTSLGLTILASHRGGFSVIGTESTPAVHAPTETKLMCPNESTPELPTNVYSATTIAT